LLIGRTYSNTFRFIQRISSPRFLLSVIFSGHDRGVAASNDINRPRQIGTGPVDPCWKDVSCFEVPHIGEVKNRITLLNIFDRTNLIRPAEGIGIFQAAYGPRITVSTL
jgi:hypothetical protein